MAEKERSVASFLNFGSNPIAALNSMWKEVKSIDETEYEKLLPTTPEDEEDDEDDFEIIDLKSLSVVDSGIKQERFEMKEMTATTCTPPTSSTEETNWATHDLPLSSMQKRFLKERKSVAQLVCTELEEEGINASIDVDHVQVSVKSTKKEDATKAIEFIKDFVVETKLDISADDLQIMTEVMDIKDDEHVLPMPGTTKEQEALVVFDRKKGSVVLVGLKPVIDEVHENIRKSQELLDRQTSLEVRDRQTPMEAADRQTSLEATSMLPETVVIEIVYVKEDALEFMLVFKEAAISSLKAINPNVKISFTSDGFEICGLPSNVREAVKDVRDLVGQVCSDKFSFTADVNIRSFTDATVKAGNKYNVIIKYKQTNVRAMTQLNQTRVRSQDGRSQSSVRQEPRVEIVFERMENHQADVLVNTTNKQLRLQDGCGVSNSILRATGNSIQEQLNSQYEGGITHGDLAVSGPGNLTNCQSIYHAALPFYTGQRETMPLSCCYEYLLSVVFATLIYATREGHHTIALPAFGTGALQYPLRNVVQLMFKAFHLFNSDNSTGSSIREIHIVIAPESPLAVKQIFLAHGLTFWMKTRLLTIQARPGLLSSILRIYGVPQRNSPESQIQREVRRNDQANCEVRVQVGDILVQVLHGDIKKACEYRDTILVPWVGQEIRTPNDQAALRCIDPTKQVWSCLSQVSEIRRTKFNVDRTTLQAKTLIHVHADDVEETSLRRILKLGVQEAGRAGSRAIVIPIPQDGLLSARPMATAEAIGYGLRRSMNCGIYVVTVVVPDADIFTDVASTLCHIGEPTDPADISTVQLVDNLWSVRFSGTARRFATRAAAFSEDVDCCMVVTSDSRQRNREAAQEVAAELRTPLYDIINTVENAP